MGRLVFALCPYLRLCLLADGDAAFPYDLSPFQPFDDDLYYSAVTFTTLGFGDVAPKTEFAALLITAEVVVGYIMLGA